MHEENGILIDDPESWFNGILSVLNDKRTPSVARKCADYSRHGDHRDPMSRNCFVENPDLRAYVQGEHGPGPIWRAIPYLEGSGIRFRLIRHFRPIA